MFIYINKNIFIIYTFFLFNNKKFKKKSLIILLFYDVRLRLLNLVLNSFFEVYNRCGFRFCVPDVI